MQKYLRQTMIAFDLALFFTGSLAHLRTFPHIQDYSRNRVNKEVLQSACFLSFSRSYKFFLFNDYRDNLQLLRQQYYYATWKADGTRYMMLINVDGCYLIDRSFNFRRLPFKFTIETN
ncbi:hypothetical protein F8388_020284 [Cannabis sativa]|uniref:mRNA capping enzyme adenylation domain-containing protein n=1 Tax=Cannabis sativa TaxID=3483 RepID=A0A7J6FVI4_CANSA|nr:hypothetical protein F8388_020284 [Cannabis sativa]